MEKIVAERKRQKQLKGCMIVELILIPFLVVIVGLLALVYFDVILKPVEVVEKGPALVASSETVDTSNYEEGWAYSRVSRPTLKLSGDGQSVTISWEDKSRQVEYFAPGKQEVWYYDTDEYQVEFYTRDDTWARAPQYSSCYSVRNAFSCE